MSRNYNPSTIDVVGDLVNGLHVETSTFNTATYWDGLTAALPYHAQCNMFNVYGRILLLQLYVEMVTDSGGGATLIQFNATFTTPSVGVQVMSAASATTAALKAGGRVVWIGGAVASIPVVTVLADGGISDVIAINRQIIGMEGGVGLIGTHASIADNVSGTARGNLFYAPLSDDAYVTAAL
jgi:hypothetical protein